MKRADTDTNTIRDYMKVIASKTTEDVVIARFRTWSKLLEDKHIERSEIPLTTWEWDFLSTLEIRMQPSPQQRKILHEIGTKIYFRGGK